MFKSSANQSQLLGRSGNHSTRPSARGANLLNWDLGIQESMTPQQKLEAAVAAYKRQTEVRIRMKATLGRGGISKEEYDDFGRKLAEMTIEISKLRKEAKAQKGDDIGLYIILLMRRKMTKTEWTLLVKEAADLRETDPEIIHEYDLPHRRSWWQGRGKWIAKT
ncbi:hypothetical protein [Achromobacter marplatensis]|uniref:Uncharacterized protein n=1 Tax=Achromobacter marplatensis TaxID=470868 RepID=A0AA42W9L3_9BURK|nr:hypothetical protein [Achromobacter marplatensis]MDH2051205.1 hypothetical protein [Achromobacter marplatensis]